MKYVVVLGDGMADEPIEELGGKTPLEAAKTPVMDELAKMSEIGMVRTIPEGMSPGSDTANLSVLGYNPRKYYTGRSPLEALSIGVDMKDTDVVYRCNIVTLTEEDCPYEQQKIVDHSSGEISTEDAKIPVKSAQRKPRSCWRLYGKNWKRIRTDFMWEPVTATVWYGRMYRFWNWCLRTMY